jgi:hypothetical protein
MRCSGVLAWIEVQGARGVGACCHRCGTLPFGQWGDVEVGRMRLCAVFGAEVMVEKFRVKLEST